MCSELLLESLVALRSLPEATLFHSATVSKVWIDVVDRAEKFLKQVVSGDVAGRGGPTPPLEDRYTALALLLELDIQKASLSGLLSNVMLLLNLWTAESQNTRGSVKNNRAPLLPVLKRFQEIKATSNCDAYGMGDDDYENINPCETFLEYLEYPEDDTQNIDLKERYSN